MERKPATGRHRRTREKGRGTGNKISLGQLCASVAYHYKLTPWQIAQFSGQQLILWYERAANERGYEKLLDLQVELVPHSDDPNKSLREINEVLSSMMNGKDNG